MAGPLISPEMLAGLQALDERTMGGRGILKRRPTDPETGVQVGAYATVYEDVPYSITPLASVGGLEHSPFQRSGVRQEANTTRGRRLITVPVRYTVLHGDRFETVTSSYEVMDVSSDDDAPTSWLLDAEKVRKA
ncbi:MAG TPA: hypothetical protein VF914_14300 [Chloroflexia bacterium]